MKRLFTGGRVVSGSGVTNADVLVDALTAQEMEGRFISELQLNYSQECKAGETMEISRLMGEDSCYIDGCSDDGKRRFEATVQFQPYR